MTYVKFSCGHCGQSLQCEADMTGTLIDCPACNKQVKVPGVPLAVRKKLAQKQEDAQASTQQERPALPQTSPAVATPPPVQNPHPLGKAALIAAIAAPFATILAICLWPSVSAWLDLPEPAFMLIYTPLIVPIVLGHIARRKCSKEHANCKGSKLSIAGLVIGYLVTAAFVPISIASCNRAQAQSATYQRYVQCMDNLRCIDSAKLQTSLAEKWSDTSDCNSPARRDVVNKYMPTGDLPTCPDGGTIDYGKMNILPSCSVHGPMKIIAKVYTCPACKGSKRYKGTDDYGVSRNEKCQNCSGTGFTYAHPCRHCRGSGWYKGTDVNGTYRDESCAACIGTGTVYSNP